MTTGVRSAPGCRSKPATSELNQIRLLHIVGDSSFGGAGKVILSLAEMMQRDGCRVEVLTSNPLFQEAAKRCGIPTVNLDVIRREIRPLWDLAGLFRLYRFLRRSRYDLVHTHTSKAGFVGRLAARLAGVPIIVHTTHGFAFHETSPRKKRLFYSTLEWLAARWCHRIVSVNKFHRQWALELGICAPEKMIAIPNGIPRQRPVSPAVTAELRRAWGVQEGETVILTIGRLAREKGLEHLIEAASILRHTGQCFRVVLAGDGPLRAQLAQLASDHDMSAQVVFTGYRTDIPQLLAACDLVVLPSLREGLSIAFLESMQAGKAIIATSIGPNLAVASHHEIALFVPPCDPESLANAILKCSQNPDLRSRLGRNARLLFESSYTEEKMLNGYRHVYLELIGRSSESVPVRTSVPTRAVSTNLVRRAQETDLDNIVEVHQKAFRHFFLSELGRAFLERYYRLVLHENGILLVSERDRQIEGFVCGFADPGRFYAVMHVRRSSFVVPVLAALIRKPWLVTKVIQGVRRVGTQGGLNTRPYCELSSIAVLPEASGRGIGKTLVKAFLEQAWSIGAPHVRLDTDATGNQEVNCLYKKIGFRLTRQFEKTRGRLMNEYVIDRPMGNETCPTLLYEHTADRP